MNYIRAYVKDQDIAEILDISRGTLRKIAQGKSGGSTKTREQIAKLEHNVSNKVSAMYVEQVKRSEDKTLSANSRSLAKQRAKELLKENFTYEQATKRQTIVKEQPKKYQKVIEEEYLPFIYASQFLNEYAQGLNDRQYAQLLSRFSHNGHSLKVTNINGNVIFSKNKLRANSRVQIRGTVYVNNFAHGINQVVRDLNYIFPSGQTLAHAVETGFDYFAECFAGHDHLDVNIPFMDMGAPKHPDKQSRGEKYEALSKWLVERMYLGVIVYQ